MSLAKTASKLLILGLLPGILGGLFAFVVLNVWFFYFGAYLAPGLSGRTPLPDFFFYLPLDVFVGAGCGYAGSLSGPALADLFGGQPRLTRPVPMLYAFVLGLGISSIVNGLLLFLSFI